MFLSYVSRTAPAVALVILGAAAAAVDYSSGIAAQSAAASADQSRARSAARTSTCRGAPAPARAGVYRSRPVAQAPQICRGADDATSTSRRCPEADFVRSRLDRRLQRPVQRGPVRVRLHCDRRRRPAGQPGEASRGRLAASAAARATCSKWDRPAAPPISAALRSTARSLVTSAPTGLYYLRVKAVNRCGISGPSNEAIAAVGVADRHRSRPRRRPPTPPAPPTPPTPPAPPTPPTPPAPPTPPTPTPGSIFGIVDAIDPRHLLGGDARQVGRRRRRRLQVPHLASADRPVGLRLRPRARRQPGLDSGAGDRRLAGALRLHRPPAPDARRAQRPRGSARGLQGVHRQPRRRRTTRAA